MMQPHELRIGNWITVMGSIPTQVTAHYLYMMETYTPADPEEEADYKEMTNPIPLTEEWLLKFGFHRQTNSHYYIFYNDKVLLTIYNGSLVIEGSFMSIKLEYVHQLQNLYFALTGKELELTPSTV